MYAVKKRVNKQKCGLFGYVPKESKNNMAGDNSFLRFSYSFSYFFKRYLG